MIGGLIGDGTGGISGDGAFVLFLGWAVFLIAFRLATWNWRYDPEDDDG